jgi:hypothetical protein
MNFWNASRRRFRSATNATERLEDRTLMAADLSITTGSFLISPPNDPSTSTLTLNFTVTVKNNGDQNADLTGLANTLNDNVILRLFASTNSTFDQNVDTQLGEFKIGEDGNTTVVLGPNQTTQVEFTAEVTANPQNKFLLIQLDSTNLIAESNENNNIAAFDTKNPFIGTSPIPRTIKSKKTIAMDGFALALDLDNTELGGSQWQITQSNFQTGDVLSIKPTKLAAGKLKRVGDNLLVGKTTVGTFTGGLNGSSVTIAFGQTADRALVNGVIRALSFQSAKGAVGTRNFNLKFIDPDGNDSPTRQTTVNVV